VSQPIYYAIWHGRPGEWAYLFTTTKHEQDAREIVRSVEAVGHAAYYTTEQGPIVPLGSPDDEDDRCYCCGDEYGHDADPGGVFHIGEKVLAMARKERGE
jgi:hypothetical protein